MYTATQEVARQVARPNVKTYGFGDARIKGFGFVEKLEKLQTPIKPKVSESKTHLTYACILQPHSTYVAIGMYLCRYSNSYICT